MYLRFTYLENLPVAALMQQRQDGNATKMYLKGHDISWHFQRHPELLRTSLLEGVCMCIQGQNIAPPMTGKVRQRKGKNNNNNNSKKQESKVKKEKKSKCYLLLTKSYFPVEVFTKVTKALQSVTH